MNRRKILIGLEALLSGAVIAGMITAGVGFLKDNKKLTENALYTSFALCVTGTMVSVAGGDITYG